MDEKFATTFFSQGYSCTQSVLLSQQETTGLPAEVAVRAAAAFGGGMGRQGFTCGAVTGAFIALGMRYGSLDPNDKAAKEQVYELVRRFSTLFEARHGSLNCRDLLGYDISDPQSYAQAREQGAFRTRCPAFVQSAEEILEELAG